MQFNTSHSSLRPFGWCFILLSIALAAGCGGGGGSGGGGSGSSGSGPTIIAPTAPTTSLSAEPTSIERARAIAAAAAIQDADNQARKAALQEFGAGVFGESTFQ
jgi:hypothetical protein